MPADEPTPETKTQEKAPAAPVQPIALAAPFGLMAGVAGLATFYLASYAFPFLLSGAGLALGILGHRRARDRLTLAAIIVGGVGLLLEIITIALA